jgi:O-antigen/teichoic acid export membrane protein
MIARSLGPSEYGDYAFLLGSFTALSSLVDFGASRAFFTLMSQKFRGRSFILSYVAWQIVQFVLIVSVVGILLPEEWIDYVWLGKERNLVLLSFCAVFMHMSVWQTMTNIAESFRLTHKIQYLNIGIATANFCLIGVFWVFDSLTLKVVFSLVLFEYAIALVVAFQVLSLRSIADEPLNLKATFDEYKIFCIPLIFQGWLSFGYQFSDRWLLQYYGGSQEQGFYSIGYRFSVISLLATMSILKIFWKEIAEAQQNSDFERVRKLYKKISRLLFMVGVVVSGFLIPWSADLVGLTLGPAFLAGSLPLAIMLLYPLHQSLAQINAAMLLASSRTKLHLIISGIFMGVSIPVTYMVLAPEMAAIPGFGMGAVGMAIKMVVLQFIMVTVGSWWLAKINKWPYDWKYQLISAGSIFLVGWLSYELTFWLGTIFDIGLILRAVIASFVYAPLVGLIIWFFPELAGLSQQEVRLHIANALKFGHS